MRIGVDLDNVIYPYCEVMHGWCEYKLGRKLQPAAHWHYYEDWGITAVEYNALMAEGHAAGVVFWDGVPLAGAVEVLAKLKEQHEIFIVTHRPEYAVATTHWWVNDWKIPHHELHIALDGDKTKYGLDVLIDDGPHNLDAQLAAGGAALAFDCPWNKDWCPDWELPWMPMGWDDGFELISDLLNVAESKLAT